jgi:DEAD/DEAH box helicase domain-containing protein
VKSWLASGWLQSCLCVDATFAATPGAFTPLPASLSPGVTRALRARGIERLYTHQTRAIEAACAGRHVVLATPTASGKSVAFHAPVLQALCEDPDARAIYVYPTKALARDQEAGLIELMKQSGLSCSAIVYDGDTPADARRAARERARVVLTNPDMLHTAILPHHASWSRTLQNLRYVVVDELHTYKGVFGSQVANVLRRLQRIAAFHGSRPRLIGATATIGNPHEHAARLFGVSEEEITVVSENGAPRGRRRLFIFNPPIVNSELGIRASYLKQSVRLASDLVRARVPTLVFGQSRNAVEVMLRYLREAVATDVRRTDKGAGIDPSRIMAYRGGYLPSERRDVERRLREGEILCVVATNALELGIDVGELDAVICAGYPGSVAATWQRFGRAGRRNGQSLCVLVASSDPLDQYLAREPQFLQGAPIEQARIDPDNTEILIQHLKCAAFELPFKRGECFGSLDADETADAMSFLAQHHVVHASAGTFHWAADAYPANDVSLRSVGWDNVVIVDVAHDRCIAELDWRSAHTMLHEQAIYQHDGGCWQVERFDRDNGKAFVRRVEPDYWTSAMTCTKVTLLEDTATGPILAGTWTGGWGEVSVVEKVVGYKKIKFFTHENAGYGDVRLPEMQMHTTAIWLTLPDHEKRTGLLVDRAAAVDALRGIGVALETVAALALMADPRDLGSALADSEQDTPFPTAYRPTLFLYEHVPGGTGLAERIWEQREWMLARTLEMIRTCPCSAGCPACVGPGEPSRKAMALQLLSAAPLAQAVASASPLTCETSG